MASSRGNAQSDTAREEQIITKFFTKTLQIILESRSPYISSGNCSGEQAVLSPSSSSSSSSSSSFRSRDKWFNLALRDCPATLENTDFWRHSNLEPMVVDVILVRSSLDKDTLNFDSIGDSVKKGPSKGQAPKSVKLQYGGIVVGSRSEKVIERWVVQYEGTMSRGCSPGSKRLYLCGLYKKSIVLLRSLYTMMKLLPAYKLFRDLISSGHSWTYTFAHRVSSFVEPFTRREEADMKRFSFSPVDTSCGRLCLSVSYRTSLSDMCLEPSTPTSPRFIPDYVGSPLAVPLKRFPSLPVCRDSPTCSPFSRRRSWSYENYQASSPSTLPCPSPTDSNSHKSVSKFRSRLPPPLNLPQLPGGGRQSSFNEYRPYPVFSPSPSPSPPIHAAKTTASTVLLRSESAPVSSIASKASKKQHYPPSPSKLTRAATLESDKSRGASRSSAQKVSVRKDESGRPSGVWLSSNSKPQISVSRSSSRLSIQDDFDDSDFVCHFAMDDYDMIDTVSRANSIDQKGQLTDPNEPREPGMIRKSHDAAVGALILMLKKAPPLHQKTPENSDPTNCVSNEQLVQKPDDQQSQNGTDSVSSLSSRYSLLKTRADALKELQSYKGMKDLLLRKGCKSLVSKGSSAIEGSSEGEPK